MKPQGNDGPTAPHRPPRSLRDYRAIPGVRPRRVRRDLSDGYLYGEVRVEATDTIDPAEKTPQAFRPPYPRAIPDADGHDHRPAPELAFTVAEFTTALKRYRSWAGLSFRDMEDRCGGGKFSFSASTFCTALKRSSLPSQALLVAFITACGAGPAECRRWVTALRRIQDTQD